LTFASFDIRPSTLAALAALDISIPTPIQAEAIPILLDGHDIIGQAHTGSGKTLAFGVPLVERCDPSKDYVQALVLTPTRELAQQVGQVLAAIGRPAGLRDVTIYGGVGYGPQIDALERGVHVVVGTPGRVLDHMQRGTLDVRGVEVLVLDEADEMLDRGFARDVERILSHTPKTRQTALFSATTPTWVHEVSAKYLREPKIVHIDDESEEPDIQHSVIEVWSGDKLPVLIKLLNQDIGGATLVFGRTRHGVENLARRLRRMGYEVEALQGDLGQAARDRIVARFRNGHLPVLLATNVAARGLDMLNIERVINYDLPDTGELFVHRVGLTGRIGNTGEAITLISAVDLPKMREIERHIGKRLPRVDANTLPMLPLPSQLKAAPPAPVAPPQPVAVAQSADGASTARKRRRRRRGSGQGAQGQVATPQVSTAYATS
jgi:ATP-dependent RNA helicase DeaD